MIYAVMRNLFYSIIVLLSSHDIINITIQKGELTQTEEMFSTLFNHYTLIYRDFQSSAARLLYVGMALKRYWRSISGAIFQRFVRSLGITYMRHVKDPVRLADAQALVRLHCTLWH